jgi:hypothetical protein
LWESWYVVEPGDPQIQNGLGKRYGQHTSEAIEELKREGIG